MIPAAVLMAFTARGFGAAAAEEELAGAVVADCVSAAAEAAIGPGRGDAEEPE
jgi:hypothetical protein